MLPLLAVGEWDTYTQMLTTASYASFTFKFRGTSIPPDGKTNPLALHACHCCVPDMVTWLGRD